MNKSFLDKMDTLKDQIRIIKAEAYSELYEDSNSGLKVTGKKVSSVRRKLDEIIMKLDEIKNILD